MWREKGNRRTSLVMSMYGEGMDDPNLGIDNAGEESWSFGVSLSFLYALIFVLFADRLAGASLSDPSSRRKRTRLGLSAHFHY